MISLQKKLVHDPRFKQAFKEVSIFGVAGTNGSGKDTLMDVLRNEGYLLYNMGDHLREVSHAATGSMKRGGNDSPVGSIGNAQRACYPGGMVDLALIDYWSRVLHLPKKLRPRGLVMGSLRSISEAERLKEFGGTLVVSDADQKVRYERLLSRARAYEHAITFEQFKAEEEGDLADSESDPTKFSMAKVIAAADILIKNDKNNIEAFKKQVKNALGL